LPEQLLVDREIALSASRKRARQLMMAGEGRLLGLEGDVSEHVVGMHVGVDDVLDEAFAGERIIAPTLLVDDK